MKESFPVIQPNAHTEFSFSESFLARHEPEILQAIERSLKIDKRFLSKSHCKEAYIINIESDTAYIKVLCICAVETESGSEIAEYIVDCAGSISKRLEDLFFRGVCKRYPSFSEDRYLPDNLIPEIRQADLDKVAEQILRKVYPRALSYAVPLPVATFAKELGLHIEYAGIDPDGEILGQIFFESATTTVYRPDGVAQILSVTPGTIIAGGKFPYCLATAPQSRNTVIHECVHWMLHRAAFMLSATAESKAAMMACRNISAASNNQTRTPLEQMEWQANALAPRLLMPAWAVRFVAERWMHKLERLPLKLRMERVIEHVSAHFETSKQMTKIRLLELGYQDAALAFNYSNKEQYEIEPIQIAREYYRNPVFRNALSDGQYAYIDKCFVLRNLKYIERDDAGTLRLTPYAKKHLSECCLSFQKKRAPIPAWNGMYRGHAEDAVFMEGSKAELDPGELKALNALLQSLPASFGGTLTAHMKRKHFTDMRLADATLLSDKTIRNYRNSPFGQVLLSTSVALCVGLHLHPVLSYNMVDKTSNKFIPTLEHTAYQIILQTMTFKTIYECNDFLKSLGIRPLTGKEE